MAKVYKPYPYQEYIQKLIVEKPALGLFLDMGLGKTVITLSAFNDLKFNRWSAAKMLVIAPKKVERPRQVYVQSLIEKLGFKVFSAVDSPEKVANVVEYCKEVSR